MFLVGGGKALLTISRGMWVEYPYIKVRSFNPPPPPPPPPPPIHYHPLAPPPHPFFWAEEGGCFSLVVTIGYGTDYILSFKL